MAQNPLDRPAWEYDPHQRARATPFRPGSPEKIAELALRVEARQPTNVPGDRPGQDGEGVPKVCKTFHTALFAEQLRRRRALAGLSVTALARAAGMARRLIYFLEAGEHSPTLDTVAALAAALGCEPWQLLTDAPVAGRAGR